MRWPGAVSGIGSRSGSDPTSYASWSSRSASGWVSFTSTISVSAASMQATLCPIEVDGINQSSPTAIASMTATSIGP